MARLLFALCRCFARDSYPFISYFKHGQVGLRHLRIDAVAPIQGEDDAVIGVSSKVLPGWTWVGTFYFLFSGLFVASGHYCLLTADTILEATRMVNL